MTTVVFFNNKGGVGKTWLVYHLAWMYADLGVSVIAADLDPQASLSSMFVEDERLEELWCEHPCRQTVFGAIRSFLDGTGDISTPHIEQVGDGLGLLVGDLALSVAEAQSNASGPESYLRLVHALWRVIDLAARAREAKLVLIDVGPNLGLVNRAALIAAEHLVIPLAPDLYSLQGLRNLGPALRRWRGEWNDLRARNPATQLSLPSGHMKVAGYVVLRHPQRLDQPAKRQRSRAQILYAFREATVEPLPDTMPGSFEEDPDCLAVLMHYRSLFPLAQEARKPMFFLKPADGLTGGHAPAVQQCYREFRELAQRIAGRCGLAI